MGYLRIYNAAQACGWAAVLALLALSALDPSLRWLSLRVALVFQALMALDVVNAGAGLVGGGVAGPLLQVLSRNAFSLGLFPGMIASSEFPPLAYCLLASWGLAEVSRYSFYCFKGVRALGAVRYNIFFLTFALGLASEAPLLLWRYRRTGRAVYLFLVAAYCWVFPRQFMLLLRARARFYRSRPQ